MAPIIVLWIYIVLLLAGGLMGYLKAKSKISLISALVFGALLSVCALGFWSALVADILIGVLLLTFLIRFAKGRKFMPSGLMIVLSIAALALRFLLK